MLNTKLKSSFVQNAVYQKLGCKFLSVYGDNNNNQYVYNKNKLSINDNRIGHNETL